MNNYVKYNQSEQDYLETLLTLGCEQDVVHRIDVAKRMNVSQAAVNKAVKLFCEKEYVYEDGKHLYLTESGKAYAESVFERHCIIREFLLKNGVPAAIAEEDACRMEHLISEETFQMMKNFVRNK
ncbi:MAG: metal-dependent transcriptional regulator [Clostridia bacterium]|nr:metal-dependent transcriptional regulator [Clostridia bacterium]